MVAVHALLAAMISPPPGRGEYNVGRDAPASCVEGDDDDVGCDAPVSRRDGEDDVATFFANDPADTGDGFDIGALRFVEPLRGDETIMSRRPFTVS